MRAELLTKLKAILEALDEDGLVALANKGLVRRAMKDLETIRICIEDESDQFVIKGPDWTVWMPADGPAKAKDDTPASGITRQIICATIYLRQHLLTRKEGSAAEQIEPLLDNKENEPTQHTTGFNEQTNHKIVDTPKVSEAKLLSAAEIKVLLLKLTPAELIKWCGKSLFKEVQEQTALDMQEEQSGSGLIFRFPLHDIEVRILPSFDSSAKALLEAIISTAPKSLHKRWVLSAILELNKAAGKEIEYQEKSLANVEEQKKILRSTRVLLENMLAAGISHPSERTKERLSTLSVSAASNFMPRLAYLLRTLSHEIHQLLNREASANTQLLFDNMSWTIALSKAIDNATDESKTEFAGVARTQYFNTSELSLCGLGAYPWQSESGFEGLTILFWEITKAKLYTWSASRPKANSADFDVDHIYNFESVWSGSGTASSLSRSRFTLRNARANAAGRLSSAQQTSVSNIANIESNQIDFGKKEINNWSELREYASSQYPCGLKLLNPLDRILIIKPNRWGERYYDEMQQALCWQLFDGSEQMVLLTLPWNQTNEKAIEFIESLKPDRDKLDKIVVRVVINNSGYAVEPITFISKGTPSGDQILNPSFDHKRIEYRQSVLLEKLRKKYSRTSIPTALQPDDDWQEMLKSQSVSEFAPPIIHQSLAELETILLFLAESGAKNINDLSRNELHHLSDKLSRAGLMALSGQLARALKNERILPSDILWLNYLCKLHWQALAKTFAA